MLERFTVDRVAAAIGNYVADESPQNRQLDRKIVHKFLRKGRWAARKGHSWQPLHSFLGDTIDLAANQIAQQFVDRLSPLEAEFDRVIAVRAGFPIDQPPLNLNSDAPGKPDPPSGEAPAQMRGMKDAYQEVMEKRYQDGLRAFNAERKAAHDATSQQIEEADSAIDTAEAAIEALERSSRQRIETAHEAGELLWARYRDGFEIGTRSTKSKSTTPEADLPPEGITFEVPEILTDAAAERRGDERAKSRASVTRAGVNQSRSNIEVARTREEV